MKTRRLLTFFVVFSMVFSISSNALAARQKQGPVLPDGGTGWYKNHGEETPIVDPIVVEPVIEPAEIATEPVTEPMVEEEAAEPTNNNPVSSDLGIVETTLEPIVATSIAAATVTLASNTTQLVLAAPTGSSGTSGAIWTTTNTCSDPQDENHYAIGDIIFINGSGFNLNEVLSWSITGQPGGASADPDRVVAFGTVTVHAGTYDYSVDPATDGSTAGTSGTAITPPPTSDFCFAAYVVQPGDAGEYQTKVVDTKGDNYRVDGFVEPPPPPPDEICGDGIDNDGDGLVDENCPPPGGSGRLTVVKLVVNDNGGALVSSSFTLHVKFGGSDVSNSPFPGSSAGTTFVLPSGNTYVVGEDSETGYALTIGGDCTGSGFVTLASGDDKTCILTNDDIPGEISGIKFEDTNGNGVRDLGEPGLADWTIVLAGTMSSSTVTGAEGSYSFDNLPWGTYTVHEVLVDGWVQKTADPAPVELPFGGSVTGVNFGNFKLAEVSGTKWLDTNGNGVRDAGDNGIAGWTIFVDQNANGTLDFGELSTTTNATGDYTFLLDLGTYQICEMAVSGWRETSPSPGYCYNVVVNSSGQVFSGTSFGNHPDREGTMGFWKNWDRHNTYTIAEINSWLATINADSKWLMTEAGFSADVSGMVALIETATKQCELANGSLLCAKLKFSAQYMTTRLDVESGRKNLATPYAVTADAQALLSLGSMEPLGDIIAATEGLPTSLSTSDFHTLANLFDLINNTGI